MSILILAAIVVVLVVIAFRQGGLTLVGSGLGEGTSLLLSVAPNLLVGFAMAGLVTVLLPAELISRWIGEGSGLTGLVVATIAGTLTPGGPFLQFPLVAALAKAGAAPGPMVAYLTAWSLLGFQRFVLWELPVLGAPFAVSRWVVSLLVPILAGLVVPIVLRTVTRT